MFFKRRYSLYLVLVLFNITNTMLFTTYFLYLTDVLGLSYSLALLLDLPVFISQFFVELPSGFFADRFGLKKSVIISVTLLTFAPMVYLLTTNYVLLFMNGITYGAGFAFFSGAFDALAVETFDGDTKRYFTMNHLISNSLKVIIPVITVAGISVFGLRAFYGFDLFFKILILLTVVFLVADVKAHRKAPKYGLEFLKDGYKSVKNQLRASKSLTYQAQSQLLWGIASFAVDVFWIKTISLSAGENNIGLVFAGASILAIFGNFIAYRTGYMKTTYWVTFFIHTLFVLGIAPFVGTPIVILMILGRSFFINIHEVLSFVIVNEIIQEDRASVLSLFSFLTNIGQIIGTLTIGLVADSLGVAYVWLIAGIILLVISRQMYLVQKWMK